MNRIKTKCRECGKFFMANKYSIDHKTGGKYCSKKCSNKARTLGKIRICKICGKLFFAHLCSIKQGIAECCSDSCSRISRRKREIRYCETCGKEFTSTPSNILTGRGKYCSHKCYGKAITKEKSSIICSECGKEFFVRKKDMKKHEIKYCSRSCYFKNLIEYWVGGFWYGSVKYPNAYYCEKWTENLKERVRAFFGYRCFECGSIQNNIKLSVHHVHYDKKTCCNGSPHDLVPLCRSCHGKTNHNRTYWEDYLTKKLYSKNPDGKCFFTKDEFEKYIKNNL
jgi:hypothetical protein